MQCCLWSRLTLVFSHALSVGLQGVPAELAYPASPLLAREISAPREPGSVPRTALALGRAVRVSQLIKVPSPLLLVAFWCRKVQNCLTAGVDPATTEHQAGGLEAAFPVTPSLTLWTGVLGPSTGLFPGVLAVVQ